ncbi:MAG: DUF4115 domain-containing protein [Nitrospirae bacterium]|nr:DUF4115 domain-containing protein [Nitrospirota bacterium]
MDTPGYILKTEREKQNKSLEEIAATLKLNIEYLRAIEDEKYDLVPAEIYTKAYLRFYARALGLDSDQIINLYQNKTAAPPVQKPQPPIEKKAGFPFKPALIISAVVVIAVLIAVIAKLQQPRVETVREKELPAATETDRPEIREETRELREPEQTREIIEPEIKEAPDQQAPAARGHLSLIIAAADTTWISVSIDGKEPGEWLLKKGEELSLSASEKFVIKTGNAGGTRVVFNGEDMGVLGEQGKIAELVLPKTAKTTY